VVEHNETNAGRVDLPREASSGKWIPGGTVGTAQDWEFNTPAAALNPSGTEFAISASHEDGTHLGVFAGSVLWNRRKRRKARSPRRT